MAADTRTSIGWRSIPLYGGKRRPPRRPHRRRWRFRTTTAVCGWPSTPARTAMF